MPHDNYALIPHTHEPALLLLQNAEGWTLPHLDAIDTVNINASIKAQLRYDTTVLYCTNDRYKDDEREEQHLVYVLENHSPDFLLPPVRGNVYSLISPLKNDRNMRQRFHTGCVSF